MNYEKMTKAELIKTLKSFQSKVDTTTGPLLCNSKLISKKELQGLLRKLQTFQEKLEEQSMEMQKLQQELEETRKRYVFSPVGYVALNDEGHIQDINLTFAALLGVERSRLIDISLTNFIYKDSINAFSNHLRQCKHSKEKVTTEVALAVKGELLWVQLLSTPRLDTELRDNLYRIAIVDISDHKPIVRSKDGYRTLTETANDAVFIVDFETGIILDINRHAENLIGMPAAEIIGSHFARLHPEEEVERYKEYFEKHFQMKEGKLDADDLVICHKDGRRINVEINTKVIEFEGGKRIIQGIFRDITDRKQENEMFTSK